jgi:hypothetical protein
VANEYASMAACNRLRSVSAKCLGRYIGSDL